jgi:hypothetical protein
MTTRKNYFSLLANKNNNSNSNGNSNGNSNNSNSISKNITITNTTNNNFVPKFNIKSLTKKDMEQHKSILAQLTALQNKISDNLEWSRTSNSQKDIFYLNRRVKIFEKPDIESQNFKNYWKFLLFCNESIKQFKLMKKTQQSFHQSNLSEEEILEFNKIAKNYSDNFNNKGLLTDKDLLHINEQIIDNKTKNKYFDKMSDDEIKDILKRRINGLLDCSTNEKRTEKQKKYYKDEYERELHNFNNVSDIKELSDLIIWSPYEFFADYSKDKIQEIYDKISNDTEKIKKLATFLPLELFDYTLEPKSISLNKNKFIDFISTGSNKNIQQLILGFSTELNEDFYKKNSYYQIYSILPFVDNLRDACNELCDYTILLNLFLIFMMSISKTKVFPICFKLPKDVYSYNPLHNSYSFRTVKPHPPNILFDEHRKFLGIHLFRYSKNDQEKIRCIFTFKNNEYGINSSLYDGAYSYYTGQELKYFNADMFFYRIENDEIFGNVGITHQEFYDLFKYHKLIPYIIGNNTSELFATRRTDNDDELKILTELLDMKPVKIQKDKYEPNKPSRFTILPFSKNNTIDYKKGTFNNISYSKKLTRKMVAGGKYKIKAKSKKSKK